MMGFINILVMIILFEMTMEQNSKNNKKYGINFRGWLIVSNELLKYLAGVKSVKSVKNPKVKEQDKRKIFPVRIYPLPVEYGVMSKGKRIRITTRDNIFIRFIKLKRYRQSFRDRILSRVTNMIIAFIKVISQ